MTNEQGLVWLLPINDPLQHDLVLALNKQGFFKIRESFSGNLVQ